MKKRLALTASLGLVMGLSLMACVPTADQQPADENYDATTRSGWDVAAEGGMEGVANALEAFATEHAPEVITLEDGRQIQRTPDSTVNGIFTMSEGAFNTYGLNADERGCDSCHQDGLGAVVDNLNFPHWSVTNGLDTNIDALDCITCHDMSDGTVHGLKYNHFGSLIHGIHSKDSFNGNCMSCHEATADGNDMRLWEEARHDVLTGILPVSEPGEFSYDQDTLGGDGVRFAWWSYSDDFTSANMEGERMDKALKNEAPDESQYDEWTISVTGLVDNPKQWTISELKEVAPVETVTSSIACEINGPNGEYITTAEITGVPLSWFLEQAGAKPEGINLVAHDPNGFGDALSHFGSGIPISEIEELGGWVIWEINGRPLDYLEGFPARVWMPGTSISDSCKWVSELEVVDILGEPKSGIGNEGEENIGVTWGPHKVTEPNATFYNKPCAAIMGTPEGLIIPVGQPYTFEGYAFGINEQIVAVEFSMDNGETWNRFDTSDSDKSLWVAWDYTFTPEEPGAYVLKVRAITDAGKISYVPDEVMVNAK